MIRNILESPFSIVLLLMGIAYFVTEIATYLGPELTALVLAIVVLCATVVGLIYVYHERK